MNDELKNIASEWSRLSAKLRNSCMEYIKTILANNDNAINWKSIELPEYVSVSYDGGNHPEYASNLYSTVYGIEWAGNVEEIVLDTEDSSDYPLSSVTTEELYNLCDFINVYKEEIGIK